MSATVAIATASALAVLAAVAFGPSLPRALRQRREVRARRPVRNVPGYDPGRELRAERHALALLRSVVHADEYDMYRELGFLSLPGGGRARGAYAYLIYPHRPIIAYDVTTGELLNEYCVGFPDAAEPGNGRLPAADDVLAKWMSLQGDERRLIGVANLHVPGRQVDPDQVRRDLLRLREWQARRARDAA